MEVAFVAIGEILIHCISDPSGIWIYHTFAKALNDCNADSMRSGF